MIKKGLVNNNQMKTAGKANAGMKVFHQGLCCISLASELSFQEAQGAVKWVKKSGLRPIQLTCCSSEILVAVRGASRHVWGIWVNFHPVLKPSSEDVVLIEHSWKISTWLCYPCWTRTEEEKPDFSVRCLFCCVGVGLAEMAGVWHTRWDWQRRGSAFS